MDICTHLFIPLKYKCHKTTSFNIALTMKQSLPHKLDDTPLKKLCEYINLYHKQ